MILSKIEHAVIERLREIFPEFEVESFPVDFAMYRFTSPVGCILVRYEKSVMSKQNDIWAVMTDETYNFTLFLGLRYLQRHSVAYPVLNKLKTVLNGFEIMNKRLEVTGVNFEDEINGDLWYAYSLQITFPLTDEYKMKGIKNE